MASPEPLIDHDLRVNELTWKGGVATRTTPYDIIEQYVLVEKEIKSIERQLEKNYVEAFQKIVILLPRLYREMNQLGSWENYNLIKERYNFSYGKLGENYFVMNGNTNMLAPRTASTIVGAYEHLIDWLYPKISAFHLMVFDGFLSYASELYHHICQHFVWNIFRGKQPVKDLLQLYEKGTKRLVDSVGGTQDRNGADAKMEHSIHTPMIASKTEKKGDSFFHISYFEKDDPVKRVKMPISNLSQHFTDNKTSPPNKVLVPFAGYKIRSEQAQFLSALWWLFDTLNLRPMKALGRMDIYDIEQFKLRVIIPLYSALLRESQNSAGFNILLAKIDSNPYFKGKFVNQFDRNHTFYQFSLVEWVYARYLGAFTISIRANVLDPSVISPSFNYLKVHHPLSLTGQLLFDCLVYASVSVYTIKEIADSLMLKLYYIQIPFHVGVIGSKSIDKWQENDDKTIYLSHNASLFIKDFTFESFAKWNESKSCIFPTENWEYIAEISTVVYQGTPAVDLPYRLIPITNKLPYEKTMWNQLVKELPKSLLFAPISTGTERNFPINYLDLYNAQAKFKNQTLRIFWNNTARHIWLKFANSKRTPKDVNIYIENLKMGIKALKEEYDLQLQIPFGDKILREQQTNHGVLFDPKTRFRCTMANIRLNLQIPDHIGKSFGETGNLYELSFYLKEIQANPIQITFKSHSPPFMRNTMYFEM